jgi:hypothetical protein
MSRALQLPAVPIICNSLGGYPAARFTSRHHGVCVAIVFDSPGGFTPHKNVLTRAFCCLQGSELVSRCAGQRMNVQYLHCLVHTRRQPLAHPHARCRVAKLCLP